MQLPHPASRLKNQYRPFILRGMVAEALQNSEYGHYDANIIDEHTITKIEEELSKSE